MTSLLEISTSFEPNMESFVAIHDSNFFNNNFNNHQALQSELLADTSLLTEIYNLRLNVWEHSGKSEFVNRKLYPNGWYDHIDSKAFHWIVFNNQHKIIASARLNLFNSFEEFPYHLSVKNLPLPDVMPFAFFSRLVVHPQYRQNGLSRQLFTSRTRFCEERGIRWSQAFINNKLIIRQFEKSGYKNIGPAQVAYHPSSEPHPVNVFIKENNYF
ncbi:MAG: GNAT family N-acetyltransferase [Ginsengibacter sp.]